MKAKLTASLVKTLKPGGKPYEVRDTDITGFLLRISPSGNGVYYLDYRMPDGRRNRCRIGTLGGVTPAQARDAAVRLSATVAMGGDPQEERKAARIKRSQEKFSTLGGFLTHKYAPWVVAERKTGKATVERILHNFRHLMDHPLEHLTPWVIEKWRSEQIKAGKAKTTINRDVVALKAALSKAVSWHVLSVNPLGDVKPLKTDSKRRVRYLTIEEERRLREALADRDANKRAGRESGNRWRHERGYTELPSLQSSLYWDHLTPLLLLTLNTGLRRGEAFNLTWDRVNFQGKTLTVEGATAKSNQSRHVPLNEEALMVLRNWRSTGTGVGLVFPGRDGKCLDNVRTAWAGVLKDAGITEFRWHDLRHTFASKLVMRGVPLNTVRELLGHGDLETTLRYAHLAPDHKADAVAQLLAG